MRPLIVTVFMGNVGATKQAIVDMLAQDGQPRVLAIQQGAEGLEDPGTITLNTESFILWRHNPPLPSLAATWNCALDFAWEIGCEEAMVVNNDVRLHPSTFMNLSASRQLHLGWFVSGVGVGAEQFGESWGTEDAGCNYCDRDNSHGGPDFGCFLISKECHEKYRFDEAMIPAYCEDADLHRRMMLGGDGDRIFSVNVPYLHSGSGTLKSMSPEKRAAWERRIGEGARAHYARKWGGGVNEETYREPFSGHSMPGMKTSVLFEAVRAGWNAAKS